MEGTVFFQHHRLPIDYHCPRTNCPSRSHRSDNHHRHLRLDLSLRVRNVYKDSRHDEIINLWYRQKCLWCITTLLLTRTLSLWRICLSKIQSNWPSNESGTFSCFLFLALDLTHLWKKKETRKSYNMQFIYCIQLFYLF